MSLSTPKVALLSFLVFNIFASNLSAELFQIINRNYGGNPQASLDAAWDSLEAQINSVLPNTSGLNYLGDTANSIVMGSSGVMNDYSTDFGLFMAGGRLGVGLNLGSTSLSDITGDSGSVDNIPGFAMQMALLVGFRPFFFPKKGFFSRDRFKFFISYFSKDIKVDTFNLSFSSIGLMAQYALIKNWRATGGWVKWRGVEISTGIRRLNQTQRMDQTLTATLSSGGVDTVASGTMSIGSDASLWSVPIEVATSAGFAYIFNAFVGLGVDINAGTSKKITALNMPVVTTNPAGASAEASLDLGEDANPSLLGARVFGGIGLDLTAFNLSAQLTQSLVGHGIGATLGLQLYW